MSTETTLFESLAALRAEHGRLLKAPKVAGLSVDGKSDLATAVVDFLARVVATGARLDTPADREAAQSVLDYWTATLFTLPNGMTAASTLPSVIPGVGPGAANLKLAEFNSKTAGDAADAAEKVFVALPTDEQALAKRILMRLVSLPSDGRDFVPTPVPRAVLTTLAPEEKVNRILNALQAAKAVRDIEGRIELQNEALTRVWARYRDFLEKRQRFRQAGQYWAQNHGEFGQKAALLSGQLLRDAEKYHDLTVDEEVFIDASRKQETALARSDRDWKWVFAALAVAAVLGWVIAARQERIAEEQAIIARAAEQEATKRGDELKKANDNLRIATQALVKKQVATALVPIARALAEVGVSAASHGRQIARERLRQLKTAYAGNPEFRPILDANADLLDRVVNDQETLEQRVKLQIAFLNEFRRVRAEAFGTVPEEVKEILVAERKEAFWMAEYCANEIVDSYSKRPYREADAFVTQFWMLYWVDMAFYEKPPVASAMVKFGGKLQDIDKKLGQLVPADQMSRTNILDEKRLTARQITQTWTHQVADDAGNRSVAEYRSKKVAPADLKALEDLRTQLEAALKKELDEPLEFDQPLKAY